MHLLKETVLYYSMNKNQYCKDDFDYPQIPWPSDTIDQNDQSADFERTSVQSHSENVPQSHYAKVP